MRAAAAVPPTAREPALPPSPACLGLVSARRSWEHSGREGRAGCVRRRSRRRLGLLPCASDGPGWRRRCSQGSEPLVVLWMPGWQRLLAAAPRPLTHDGGSIGPSGLHREGLDSSGDGPECCCGGERLKDVGIRRNAGCGMLEHIPSHSLSSFSGPTFRHHRASLATGRTQPPSAKRGAHTHTRAFSTARRPPFGRLPHLLFLSLSLSWVPHPSRLPADSPHHH
jgi:hypothetical protein